MENILAIQIDERPSGQTMTLPGFIEEVEDTVVHPKIYNLVKQLAQCTWKKMRGIQELEKNKIKEAKIQVNNANELSYVIKYLVSAFQSSEDTVSLPSPLFRL